MTTQAFRAPILRRPVDVTGSSTVTTVEPVPTEFSDGYGSGFDGWYALDANGMVLQNVFAPLNLVGASAIVVSEQRPRFPPYDADRGGYPTLLYAIVADGRSVAGWPITGVTSNILGGQIIGRIIAIGPPFMLENVGTIVAFGTNYDTTNVPVTTNTRNRLLAEITERGQLATLAVEGLAIRLDPIAGDMEYATIRTRYVADAAIGSAITDDLNRLWVVNGTATIGDRRYLEFQCSRTIGGMTL